MKKKLKWVIFYFTTVTFFSVLYSIAWSINSESFIVHKELNLAPFSDLYNTLWTNEKHNFKSTSKELDELHSHLANFKKKMSEIEKKIAEYSSREKALEKKLSKEPQN